METGLEIAKRSYLEKTQELKEQEALKARILKGKTWLVNNLESKDFEKFHKLYMQLVDEFKQKYAVPEPLSGHAEEI